MFYFQFFGEDEKNDFVKPRPGEVHFGERVSWYRPVAGKALKDFPGRFVIVGLPEDIGVRGNRGIGGAGTAWLPFLKTFLNIQNTPKLNGEDFLIYGYLSGEKEDFQEDAGLESLRKKTGELDDFVFPLIRDIVENDKIPIVIGGGHNNAYPMIKGTALAVGKGINVINIDAHADFRALEGRHSGNGFSYAYHDRFLNRYFVLGMHEAYNSENMLAEMTASPGVDFVFWEDIFIREKINWNDAVGMALEHVEEVEFGVEMDVDSIENVLSSAETPLGIQIREAMKGLYDFGQNPKSVYLHIPESVSRRADGLTNPFTGKVLSYLVQSFVKGILER